MVGVAQVDRGPVAASLQDEPREPIVEDAYLGHTFINCIPNGQSAWMSPAEIRHCREPFSGGISVWELSSFGERDVIVGKPHLDSIERTHFVDEGGVSILLDQSLRSRRFESGARNHLDLLLTG
jgi:hypothetical protein